MGTAAHIAGEELEQELPRLLSFRRRFLQALSPLPHMHVNGHLEHHLAGLVYISFGFVDGESLLMSLRDLALSTGSACTSVSVEPSYVLRAIGVDAELAHSSLRISFGRFTTADEVEIAAEKIMSAVEKLRQVSPAWQRYLESSKSA